MLAPVVPSITRAQVLRSVVKSALAMSAFLKVASTRSRQAWPFAGRNWRVGADRVAMN